ncbi:MAG: lasso peptide biosynthesis protein [Deltaproteobacteria bacterium]|nr:lasso peptide biosynthesis protein [Deltaproteobacteria bacterium]
MNDPAVAVFTEQLGSRFYGLYREGHKVGWLRSTFEETRFRGEPALVASGHAEIVTRGGAAVHTTVIASRHTFGLAAPHDLLRYRTSTTRGGVDEWRELRPGPGGSGWVAVAARGREAETAKPADLGAYTLSRFLALERWVADGPGLGDVLATARLDTSTLAVVPSEASVVGVTHTIVDAVPTTVYSLASFDSGAAVITRYDGEGRILAVEGGEVDLRLEPEAEAKALDAPADLFLDALITPRGELLRDADELHRLVLAIPDAAAALVPASSGQRVVRVAEGYVLEMVRGGLLRAASEDEQRTALLGDAQHPKDDGRVGVLLKSAVPPRTNRRETVKVLAEYVRDYLEDDRSAEPLDLSEVIDRRRGDCTEHAALFVTLARAAGIPAREVSGLLWVEELGAFGGHAWAEVALAGVWVPVDPTWGQVPADPAHIRLADAPRLQAAARRALKEGGVEIVEAASGVR